MTLADRIRAGMSASGVSQAELARACGVKPPSINGWLSGRAKFLRGENLLRAAQVLRVNRDWLATGRGEMSDSEALSDQEAELLRMFRAVDDEARSLVMTVVGKLSETAGRPPT